MVVSGSLSVIEALGWPKRMKTTVLYTARLNRITSSVQADRTQLIQHTEISLEFYFINIFKTLCLGITFNKVS